MLIYSLILHIRHFLYDKGILKSYSTELPSVCIGNVSAGGTGKTPMTELVVKTLLENDVPAADAELFGFEKDSLFFQQRADVAVLSRGYKRETKGFQQVTAGGTAQQFGDEPLQIKKKFPEVTVAVDADRVEGCDLLTHPEKIALLKPRKKAAIVDPKFGRSDVIVLDDAFQYRRIKATKNIVLTTYRKPYYKDFLLPLGGLRDLRGRARKADMIVVTKCPTYLTDEQRSKMAKRLGLNDYSVERCEGVNRDGKVQKLLFATIAYDTLAPVFPEGDPRYVHSKAAILFTGIANDKPLLYYLAETYQIKSHHRYPDHHYYTASDMETLAYAATKHSIAVVVTTEKDAQRLSDIRFKINEDLRHRLFYAPIRAQMLTAAEQTCLRDFLYELNN